MLAGEEAILAAQAARRREATCSIMLKLPKEESSLHKQISGWAARL